jgi:putative transposase
MKIELFSSSHSVGEANYHIQITPAYRQDIFANEMVKILTRDYLLAAASRHKITIAAIGFGPDHCHIFCTHAKNHSASQIAKLLKGFSSHMMRQNHKDLFDDKLWGNKFWSGGYFYRTVGAVNSSTVNRYVEQSQQKHWKETKGRQSQLLEFADN